MKRKLTTLLLALLATVPTLADDLSLGYCDGQQFEASVGSASAVAVLFPADEFCMYQGASIIGVRIGVAADCAKGVTLFVRSGLQDDNAFTFKTPALYEGWNDIYFDKPYTYPATSLCVGYEVATGVKPGVSGTATVNSCWVLNDNRWQNLASTGTAPLCVDCSSTAVRMPTQMWRCSPSTRLRRLWAPRLRLPVACATTPLMCSPPCA